MDFTRDELEAQHTSAYLEDLERSDRELLEDRIRSSYEFQKIDKLSRSCKRFLNSDLGRFIQNEAAVQAEAAKDALAELNICDFERRSQFIDRVRELQTEAHIPALVVTWLYRAIHKAEEEASLIYEE